MNVKKNSIICECCGKEVQLPATLFSENMVFDEYELIGNPEIRDDLIIVKALNSEGEEVSIRALRPDNSRPDAKVMAFLKEILDATRSKETVVKVGRVGGLAYQIRKPLDKYKYPNFLKFKEAFIAGDNSVHLFFLEFITHAFPVFAAKTLGLKGKHANIAVKSNSIHQLGRERVKFDLALLNSDGSPVMLVDVKFNKNIDQARLERAERILKRKYGNRKVKKVLISFIDRKVPGWRVMRMDTYIKALIKLFESEFSIGWPDDQILVITYLRYLKHYVSEMRQLRVARKTLERCLRDGNADSVNFPDFFDGVEFRALKRRLAAIKRIYKTATENERREKINIEIERHFERKERSLTIKMRWSKYFNAERRCKFENFIIPAEKSDKWDNPMMKCHIDLTRVNIPRIKAMKTHTAFWRELRKRMDEYVAEHPEYGDTPTTERYSSSLGQEYKLPLFPPLREALYETQLTKSTSNSSVALKKAITVFFRSIANLAVLQWLEVSPSTDHLETPQIALPAEMAQEKRTPYAERVAKVKELILNSDYRNRGVRLHLPSIMKYDMDNANVVKLAEFADSRESDNDDSEIRGILQEEIAKLPFLDYPVDKIKLTMKTPVGTLALSPIYKSKYSAYARTDCVTDAISGGNPKKYEENYIIVEAEKFNVVHIPVVDQILINTFRR